MVRPFAYAVLGQMKIRLIGATKGHALLKKKADALTLRFRYFVQVTHACCCMLQDWCHADAVLPCVCRAICKEIIEKKANMVRKAKPFAALAALPWSCSSSRTNGACLFSATLTRKGH